MCSSRNAAPGNERRAARGGDRRRPEAGWDLGAGFAAYLDAAWAPNAPVELHRDPQRFVLAVPGRSMDIDGSTMFYDSRSRGWRKVHNDVLAQSGELTALTNGLASCRFRLR